MQMGRHDPEATRTRHHDSGPRRSRSRSRERSSKRRDDHRTTDRRERESHRDRKDHDRGHSRRFDGNRDCPRQRNDRDRGDRNQQDWRHREIKREPSGDDRRRPTGSQNANNLPLGAPVPETEVPIEKQKPSFALSGKLAEDTNTFNGVVVKYNEPSEAKKPKRKWRLYPFKGETALDFIEIHKQSAYLFGRERKVVDIPIDHPSCSQQHAVIQFRIIEFEREDGTTGKRVRPYIIDLESSNGTFLNNKRIETKRYYEILEKDVIKFGFSTREYVLMFEEYSESDGEDNEPTETKND